MLSIKKKKNTLDLTEFTDENGSKWIQTTADDLLSANEFSDILNKIAKDKNGSEIVLARFDFKKVNKEYYDTVQDLQARLNKQNEMLKKLLVDAKITIDKKNTKLKELVKYIRKLHLLLAYHKTKPEDIEKMIPSPDALFYEPVSQPKKQVQTQSAEIPEEQEIIGYAGVEEILLDEEGNESSGK
jgi:hypothetical protein